MTLNETHDPALESWVASANAPDADFPLQNLPFGVFRRRDSYEAGRCGVAIGDQIVDLALARERGALAGVSPDTLAACNGNTLNALMALGPHAWSELRLALSRMLRRGPHAHEAMAASMVAQAEVEMLLPAHIGDYTDFYASVHHATAVGRMFRPDNPLLPNYKWVPIGYHGRASSIGVSGQRFSRPHGQVKPPEAAAPVFAPSKRLDYEFELGAFVGPGNAPGERVPIGAAESHLFGVCILNDWSARDIQAWEYQPLGPFLAKSFASTVSPWIVTLEALEPFRVAWTRATDDPQPLAYLDSPEVRRRGAFDITLECALQSERMRAGGHRPAVVSRSSFRHAYWTLGQMLAHHTSNGCNLAPGDLLGTGTQSGPSDAEAGSLLELARGGKAPITLPGGETRAFLEDGDAVVMRAWCERPGARRIGLGECVATVLPARPL